jgi:anion-transporting  ArsA/GET3 family ATPase
MVLDDLLQRRLVVLSGKGGVGKSLVGTALARVARARGKRVLLIEVDTPREAEAARYLGAGPVGPKVSEIQPGLSAVNLDPRGVMDEYVREMVKIDFLARKILENPVYHRFFAAAPGLPELMVMGKVMMLEQEREGWGRRPRYDLVILDAPATGHGLAFLKVPLAASQAVPVGPVGANARRILHLLRDPKRTARVRVAIPEEMAVVEAAEFQRLAHDEIGIEARALVLNACHERRFTQAQEAEVLRLIAEGASGRLPGGVPLAGALEAARRHLRRAKLTRFYRNWLRKRLPLPTVTLPYLFDEEIGPASVDTLAARLALA